MHFWLLTSLDGRQWRGGRLQRKLVGDQDAGCRVYIRAFSGSSRQLDAGTSSLGPISCSIWRPVIDHRLGNLANQARSSVFALSPPLALPCCRQISSESWRDWRLVASHLSNLVRAQHDDDRWTWIELSLMPAARLLRAGRIEIQRPSGIDSIGITVSIPRHVRSVNDEGERKDLDFYRVHPKI